MARLTRLQVPDGYLHVQNASGDHWILRRVAEGTYVVLRAGFRDRYNAVKWLYNYMVDNNRPTRSK